MNRTFIVLAISGSIAAYKCCELVRTLVRKSYSVQVLMTENAERFVSKLSLQTLSARPVMTSEWEEGMLHIDLKNMAAVYAVVPATANCIGKFAHGIADDLVSSTYLAMQCPTILAPAMNPGMYSNPAVQRNLGILKEDGVGIIDPTHGEVICGDSGQGKMASLEEINTRIEKILLGSDT